MFFWDLQNQLFLSVSLAFTHENTVSHKQQTSGKINDWYVPCLYTKSPNSNNISVQAHHSSANIACKLLNKCNILGTVDMSSRQTVAESRNTNVTFVHKKCMMLCESRAMFHVSKCTKKAKYWELMPHSFITGLLCKSVQHAGQYSRVNEPNLH